MGSMAEPRRFESLARSVLPDVSRPGTLASRVAAGIRDVTGLPFVSVALRIPAGVAMRGTAGARHDEIGAVKVPTGHGLGGKATELRRVVTVTDYVTDPSITKDFVEIVTREGLGGMTAIPVIHYGTPVGVLYGGIRHIGLIGDVARSGLEEAGRFLAPMLATASEVEFEALSRVQEERQRIAAELHDNVGQILFSIGATAGMLRKQDGTAAALASEIEGNARLAGTYLREALSALMPSSSGLSLSAQMRLDVSEFIARTGVSAELIARQEPIELARPVEHFLLRALHEALHNVEKHAAAQNVVVTLVFDSNCVELVIQDDGRGLGSGFDLDQQSVGRFGLMSLAGRAARLGGCLEIVNGEGGGALMRVALPVPD